MLVNAEALFRCALERRESRGAHARSDYPKLDPRWGQCNLVVQKARGGMQVSVVENRPLPYDLTEVISQSFTKYTPEEM
jgi:succinate dehydrogenase / fumarate reductase flavoprotein subunit